MIHEQLSHEFKFKYTISLLVPKGMPIFSNYFCFYNVPELKVVYFSMKTLI